MQILDKLSGLDNVTEEIIFEPCDQYSIQADLFSLAIMNNRDVPTPLEDALENMKVIEGIIESDSLGNGSHYKRF